MVYVSEMSKGRSWQAIVGGRLFVSMQGGDPSKLAVSC